MSDPSRVFDRASVRRHRDRAAGAENGGQAVLQEAAARLLDRLDDTTRRFGRALDIGGRGLVAPVLRARGMQVVAADLSERMVRRSAPLAVAMDEEMVPFAPASFDLVVASLALHWANDLPGALVQLRRVLAPGGLLLASLPALGTLAELRVALGEAEYAMRGGVSPRVSPFADLRDCAGLLQRAGFALPVADVEDISVLYRDPLDALRDLRHAGEANATQDRDRRIPPAAMFGSALAALPQEQGRTRFTLRLAVMTGWAE